MSTWTPELKAKVIASYTEAEPTPETSTEIIKDIADELELSPNGVRQVIIQAGVYVKKEAAATTTKTSSTSKEGGSKRVSKESQIEALRAVIAAKGKEVDDAILDKLTGKAAAYFTSLFTE